MRTKGVSSKMSAQKGKGYDKGDIRESKRSTARH